MINSFLSFNSYIKSLVDLDLTNLIDLNIFIYILALFSYILLEVFSLTSRVISSIKDKLILFKDKEKKNSDEKDAVTNDPNSEEENSDRESRKKEYEDKYKEYIENQKKESDLLKRKYDSLYSRLLGRYSIYDLNPPQNLIDHRHIAEKNFYPYFDYSLQDLSKKRHFLKEKEDKAPRLVRGVVYDYYKFYTDHSYNAYRLKEEYIKSKENYKKKAKEEQKSKFFSNFFSKFFGFFKSGSSKKSGVEADIDIKTGKKKKRKNSWYKRRDGYVYISAEAHEQLKQAYGSHIIFKIKDGFYGFLQKFRNLRIDLEFIPYFNQLKRLFKSWAKWSVRWANHMYWKLPYLPYFEGGGIFRILFKIPYFYQIYDILTRNRLSLYGQHKTLQKRKVKYRRKRVISEILNQEKKDKSKKKGFQSKMDSYSSSLLINYLLRHINLEKLFKKLWQDYSKHPLPTSFIYNLNADYVRFLRDTALYIRNKILKNKKLKVQSKLYNKRKLTLFHGKSRQYNRQAKYFLARAYRYVVMLLIKPSLYREQIIKFIDKFIRNLDSVEVLQYNYRIGSIFNRLRLDIWLATVTLFYPSKLSKLFEDDINILRKYRGQIINFFLNETYGYQRVGQQHFYYIFARAFSKFIKNYRPRKTTKKDRLRYLNKYRNDCGTNPSRTGKPIRQFNLTNYIATVIKSLLFKHIIKNTSNLYRQLNRTFLNEILSTKSSKFDHLRTMFAFLYKSNKPNIFSPHQTTGISTTYFFSPDLRSEELNKILSIKDPKKRQMEYAKYRKHLKDSSSRNADYKSFTRYLKLKLLESLPDNVNDLPKWYQSIRNWTNKRANTLPGYMKPRYHLLQQFIVILARFRPIINKYGLKKYRFSRRLVRKRFRTEALARILKVLRLDKQPISKFSRLATRMSRTRHSMLYDQYTFMQEIINKLITYKDPSYYKAVALLINQRSYFLRRYSYTNLILILNDLKKPSAEQVLANKDEDLKESNEGEKEAKKEEKTKASSFLSKFIGFFIYNQYTTFVSNHIKYPIKAVSNHLINLVINFYRAISLSFFAAIQFIRGTLIGKLINLGAYISTCIKETITLTLTFIRLYKEVYLLYFYLIKEWCFNKYIMIHNICGLVYRYMYNIDSLIDYWLVTLYNDLLLLFRHLCNLLKGQIYQLFYPVYSLYRMTFYLIRLATIEHIRISIVNLTRAHTSSILLRGSDLSLGVGNYIRELRISQLIQLLIQAYYYLYIRPLFALIDGLLYNIIHSFIYYFITYPIIYIQHWDDDLPSLVLYFRALAPADDLSRFIHNLIHTFFLAIYLLVTELGGLLIQEILRFIQDLFQRTLRPFITDFITRPIFYWSSALITQLATIYFRYIGEPYLMIHLYTVLYFEAYIKFMGIIINHMILRLYDFYKTYLIFNIAYYTAALELYFYLFKIISYYIILSPLILYTFIMDFIMTCRVLFLYGIELYSILGQSILFIIYQYYYKFIQFYMTNIYLFIYYAIELYTFLLTVLAEYIIKLVYMDHLIPLFVTTNSLLIGFLTLYGYFFTTLIESLRLNRFLNLVIDLYIFIFKFLFVVIYRDYIIPLIQSPISLYRFYFYFFSILVESSPILVYIKGIITRTMTNLFIVISNLVSNIIILFYYIVVSLNIQYFKYSTALFDLLFTLAPHMFTSYIHTIISLYIGIIMLQFDYFYHNILFYSFLNKFYKSVLVITYQSIHSFIFKLLFNIRLYYAYINFLIFHLQVTLFRLKEYLINLLYIRYLINRSYQFYTRFITYGEARLLGLFYFLITKLKTAKGLKIYLMKNFFGFRWIILRVKIFYQTLRRRRKYRYWYRVTKYISKCFFLTIRLIFSFFFGCFIPPIVNGVRAVVYKTIEIDLFLLSLPFYIVWSPIIILYFIISATFFDPSMYGEAFAFIIYILWFALGVIYYCIKKLITYFNFTSKLWTTLVHYSLYYLINIFRYAAFAVSSLYLTMPILLNEALYAFIGRLPYSLMRGLNYTVNIEEEIGTEFAIFCAIAILVTWMYYVWIKSTRSLVIYTRVFLLRNKSILQPSDFYTYFDWTIPFTRLQVSLNSIWSRFWLFRWKKLHLYYTDRRLLYWKLYSHYNKTIELLRSYVSWAFVNRNQLFNMYKYTGSPNKDKQWKAVYPYIIDSSKWKLTWDLRERSIFHKSFLRWIQLQTHNSSFSFKQGYWKHIPYAKHPLLPSWIMTTGNRNPMVKVYLQYVTDYSKSKKGDPLVNKFGSDYNLLTILKELEKFLKDPETIRLLIDKYSPYQLAFYFFYNFKTFITKLVDKFVDLFFYLLWASYLIYKLSFFIVSFILLFIYYTTRFFIPYNFLLSKLTGKPIKLWIRVLKIRLSKNRKIIRLDYNCIKHFIKKKLIMYGMITYYCFSSLNRWFIAFFFHLPSNIFWFCVSLLYPSNIKLAFNFLKFIFKLLKIIIYKYILRKENNILEEDINYIKDFKKNFKEELVAFLYKKYKEFRTGVWITNSPHYTVQDHGYDRDYRMRYKHRSGFRWDDPDLEMRLRNIRRKL